MSKETGGPAFPNNFVYPKNQGITLRDYFAAKAMQGLFAAGGGIVKPADQWAAQAYKMADAMLKARKQ